MDLLAVQAAPPVTRPIHILRTIPTPVDADPIMVVSYTIEGRDSAGENISFVGQCSILPDSSLLILLLPLAELMVALRCYCILYSLLTFWISRARNFKNNCVMPAADIDRHRKNKDTRRVGFLRLVYRVYFGGHAKKACQKSQSDVLIRGMDSRHCRYDTYRII